MTFSMKLSPKVEQTLWGAVGGAAICALIGFMFGGWVTGGKAKELAQEQTQKAVVAALAPICVEKFRHATNATENLIKLKAITSSYEKGTYVSSSGWATFPGNSEPNSAVAQACAETLTTTAM